MPQAPTATLAPTTTAPPAATRTPTPTITPSLTPTDLPGGDWNGEWNIYINGKEAEWHGSADFAVEGGSISGMFAILDPRNGSLYYSLTGTLDASGMVATGEWELSRGGSGAFAWQLSAENRGQFTGNLEEGTYQFCGWRADAGRPSPCEWP